MTTRDLLYTRDVATEFGIPEGTLRYWRHRNEGPPSFRVRRRVAYRRNDFESWLTAQETATRRGDA